MDLNFYPWKLFDKCILLCLHRKSNFSPLSFPILDMFGLSLAGSVCRFCILLAICRLHPPIGKVKRGDTFEIWFKRPPYELYGRSHADWVKWLLRLSFKLLVKARNNRKLSNRWLKRPNLRWTLDPKKFLGLSGTMSNKKWWELLTFLN